MQAANNWVVVGLDNGATNNNATVLDPARGFLVDRLVESPSLVQDGPERAVEALAESFESVLEVARLPGSSVRAVGLGTPGPASADGVISSQGSPNFGTPAWRRFHFRHALEDRLGLPVIYINDGNAATLHAHHTRFGAQASHYSSVAAIVGTGRGAGWLKPARWYKERLAWPVSWGMFRFR